MTRLTLIVNATKTPLPFQLKLRTLPQPLLQNLCSVHVPHKSRVQVARIFPAECIFYLATLLQHKGKIVSLCTCMTDKAELSIREAMSDDQMPVRIANIDNKLKEVKYLHY